MISPAGGISEIFRYQLVGPPDMDLIRLKTLQDWVVERRLRIVSGVADIAVLGGKTKEFQAEIAGDNVGQVVQRFWGCLEPPIRLAGSMQPCAVPTRSKKPRRNTQPIFLLEAAQVRKGCPNSRDCQWPLHACR